MRYFYITVGIIYTIICSPVLAWDCGQLPEEWAKEANLVFEGKVVGITPVYFKSTDQLTGRKITFKVSNVLLGEAGNEITVSTGIFGDSPGYPFLCQSRYTVYAIQTDNGLSTNACFPNKGSEDVPSYDKLEELIFVENAKTSAAKSYLDKLSRCNEK